MGGILTALKLISLPAYISAVTFIPSIIVSDFCFYLLPLSIPLLFIISIYTLIKRDYQKFNFLYAVLLIMISLGIASGIFEAIYENSYYAYQTGEYYSYWLVFVEIIVLASILCIAKKKDTRIYLCTYVPGLIMYFTYQIINMLD